MSQSAKKLIGILGMVLVLGAVYYVVVSMTDTEEMSEGVSSSDLAVQSEKLLRDIQRVQSVEFDDSLFSDPRFTSLTDTRVELIDVPTGRTNPFAPIE